MSGEHEVDNRWVVGVDGSSTSQRALEWALAQARNRTVDVTAVRCWERLEGLPDDPHPDDDLRAVEQHLDDLRIALGPAASGLHTRAAYGNPVSVLLDEATSAQLLVLGRRGLGGLQRLLLGAVSMQVAIHSPIPVAVIVPHARVDGALARIVVGVDGSANARAALAWSLAFANESTIIEVVGAWQPPVLATSADAATFDELASGWSEEFHRSVDEVVAASPTRAVAVVRSFHHTKPAEALLLVGASADLLVVGTRGRGPIAAALLGSVTNAVLRDPPCPIVVVPGV